MAQVLADRGDCALVFRGDDGLDELTTATTSQVWVAYGGAVRRVSVDPAKLGLTAAPDRALDGGDARFSAAVVREVLGGYSGPIRDAVLLNAAAAIAAFDEDVFDLDAGLERGLNQARHAIDSGSAAEVLDRWIEVSAQAARA